MEEKNNVIKSSITALSFTALLLLSGCSGSGGGSAVVSGVVTGSFYANALVCFDANDDGTCAGESTVATGSDGSFTLNGTATNAIVAELNGATKHEVVGDAGTLVTADTKFRIPAGAVDANGEYIVSAISTKVWDAMEQDPNLTLEQAKTEVANALGVDEVQLLENFNSPDMDSELREKLQTESDNILAFMQTYGDIDAPELRSYVSSLMLPSQIDVIDAQ